MWIHIQTSKQPFHFCLKKKFMKGQSFNQNIDLFKWPIFHLFIIFLNYWAEQTMHCKLGQVSLSKWSISNWFFRPDSISFLTQVLLTIILNWRPDSTRIIKWLTPTYFCVLILSSECQHILLPLLQKVGKKSDFLPTLWHYFCLHLLWNRSIKCTKYVRSCTWKYYK